MGRTNWKRFSLVLLTLISGPGCRDSNAPEISVRNPTSTQPSPTDDRNPTPTQPTGDRNPGATKPTGDRNPGATQPTGNRNPGATQPTSTGDQTKQPPMETKKSLITLSRIDKFNGQDWAVVLLTVQDAESSAIKFAETFLNSSQAPVLEVPYGSYIITVEYFLDAAKTQSLARSCEADRTRIHKVNQEGYSATLMVCTYPGPVSPVDSDIVIRPVVIPN
ncbi:MAG TPA: hypothetical protein VFO10_05095 [Oligoflexus sp.]|uniref:hypothetical protein n=1 Tax=Oligoflexus sp. TaxID=1971216 RepID=UPI002D806022|nr:hypothetical protein [Oligoflexus sp.]HET9236601.1 hypothetical protein [Oligoflexus sp.]